MFGKSGIDYLRNLGKYKWNFHKYVKINITKKRSNSKKKSNEKSNGSIHYGRCQNTTDLQLSILQDQDPSNYYSFREDKNANTRRSANDICQQELKNAVCMTLLEKCKMKKEDLIKATIRTMRYARSSNVLTSAVERGLKYGRKTGEIG